MSKEKETAEAKTEAKSPFMYVEGNPLPIHANMKFGDFRPYGDKSQSFTTFKMNLVAWRFFHSKMYVKNTDEEKNINDLIKEGKTKEEAILENEKKQTKQWAELYFFKDFDASGRNPLSVMLIKSYSLTNFLNEIRKYFYVTHPDTDEPCLMTDLVFEVSIKERTNQKGEFFEVEFNASLEETKIVSVLSTFLEQGHIIYDAQNISENIRNEQTYRILPNTKGWQVPDSLDKKNFLLGVPKEKELLLDEQN